MDLRRFVCSMSDDELIEALTGAVPRYILTAAARRTDCPAKLSNQKCIEVEGHTGPHRSMWEGRRWSDDDKSDYNNINF
jgi:hypothetical protein